MAGAFNWPFVLLMEHFDDTGPDQIRKEATRAVRSGVGDREGMRRLRRVAHEQPREVKRAAALCRRFYGEIMIGEIAARRLEAAVAGSFPEATTAAEWSLCREESTLIDRWDAGAFETLAERIPELAVVGATEMEEIRRSAEGPWEHSLERDLVEVLLRVELKVEADEDPRRKLERSVARYLRPIVGPDASSPEPPIRRSRVALLVAARELLVRAGSSPDDPDGTSGTG